MQEHLLSGFGGVAGKTDLLDLPHNIVGARVLGQYLIVYRQASLIRAEWIGSARQTISFNTAVLTDGPLSHNAIAQIEDTHVFVARLGTYVYRGDLYTTLISTPVERDLFYVGGLVDALEPYEVLTVTYIARRTILICIFNGATNHTLMYSIYIPHNVELPPRWGLRELEDTRIHVVGTYRSGADPTAVSWELFGGTWGATSEVWGAYRPGDFRYTAPILVNRQALATTRVYNGITTAAKWEYETRTFGIDDRDVRIDTVLVLFEGDGIAIEAVADRGADSLSSVYTEGKGVRWARFNWNKQLREVKLRFKNPPDSPGVVRIHTYGVRYRQEAEPGALVNIGGI